jgi:hypothetical protein
LGNKLVGGNNTKEDGKRVEVSVNSVEDEKGNIPAVVKITEEESKDEAEGVQSERTVTI